MSCVLASVVINDFVFFLNTVNQVFALNSVNIYHRYVVVQSGSLGMTLHKQSEHGVIAVGVPSCQKYDMSSAVCHRYLMSIISTSGKSDSLKEKKSAGRFWFVVNFFRT